MPRRADGDGDLDKMREELKGLVSRGHGSSPKAKELRAAIERIKKSTPAKGFE